MLAVRIVSALLVSALLGGLLAVGPTVPANAAPAQAVPVTAVTSLNDEWVTSISGTVAADAAPSVGLENMSVWVYDEDQGHVAATQTDAQGNYSIDALEPGTYRLLFRPQDEDYRFTSEWYDDQASFETSDPIELDAAETVTGINALLGGSATITGTVTAEGGAALERVDVTAYTKNGASPAYAVTDANGNYTIPGLRPGAYTLQFEDYSWSGFASEWWNNHAAQASAEYFSVPAGGTVTKDAALAQGGAITGTVLLEGGGEQWSIKVNAYADGKLVKSGYTDQQGTIHLDNLPAGTYTLEFTGGQGLTEWWKDQPGPESATTVTVASGETVTGINLEIARAATISGTVTLPGSPNEWLGYYRAGVFAYSTAEPSVLVASTETDRQGEYTIMGLTAGSYSLKFVAEGRNYAAEWWNDQPTQEASTPITVGNGEAVTGMNAVLDAGATISGNVKGASATNLSRFIVKALPLGVSAAPDSLMTSTDEDGNYTISGLPAGEYSLQFIPNIGHNYVGEYWNDKTFKADATYFSVAAEQEVTGKDAVLAVGASLSGSVLGELPAGVTTEDVVVEAFAKNGDSAGRTTADISGRYSLRTLRAGTYTIKFSVDTGATKLLEWWNDQPAQDTAVPVTLTDGQKQTGLNVDFASNALSATPTPTITGTREVGKTLTAAAGTWKPDPVTLSYQWYRAKVEIPGATARTYLLTADDAGAAVTVKVTGTKTGYITASKTSASVTVARMITPAPKPTITGTTTVGQKLTAVAGTWGPAPVALTYQWLRGTTKIANATASSYTLTADDAGKVISVTITGTKTGYTTAITTSAATAVIAKPLTATPVPTITGTTKVGQTLTANPGTWSPATVSLKYQWLRGGAAIAGATAKTYKLATADAGGKLTVTVTGTKAGYVPASTTSTATALVTGGVLTAPVPTVSGTTTVGQTLTAKAGSWAPATVTLKYQWLRAGAAISGATASSYKLIAADAGKTITVTVTGTKSGFTAVGKTSAATVAIANLLTATPTPTVSGATKVGQTLTANPGTWSPATVTLKYQWLRGGAAISGATASTYKLVAADGGAAITVKVTGTKSGFTTVAKTSVPTAAITKLLTATPVPTIVGTVKVGQTLTAKPGAWTPATVTLKYQWLRAGTAIAGATANTYKPVAADVGKTLTVKVTGTKTGFVTVAKASAATVNVVK